MANFFDKMLGRGTKGSGSTAKERLQVVLIHDRFNLPPEKLREMKEEILAVISKYVAVDRDSVDISLEQRDRTSSKIRAEIPLTPTRRVADPDEDVPDFVTAATLAATAKAAAADTHEANAPVAADKSEASGAAQDKDKPGADDVKTDKPEA